MSSKIKIPKDHLWPSDHYLKWTFHLHFPRSAWSRGCSKTTCLPATPRCSQVHLVQLHRIRQIIFHSGLGADGATIPLEVLDFDENSNQMLKTSPEDFPKISPAEDFPELAFSGDESGYSSLGWSSTLNWERINFCWLFHDKNTLVTYTRTLFRQWLAFRLKHFLTEQSGALFCGK